MIHIVIMCGAAIVVVLLVPLAYRAWKAKRYVTMAVNLTCIPVNLMVIYLQYILLEMGK